MRKITRTLRKAASEQGFSLTEVLVAGVVLVIGLVMISQFFASAMGRVLDSDARSVLHQVATEELESIRGLPYEDVGTTDGHPAGSLQPDEDRTINGVSVHIHREVLYWTDPSYTGPNPANYRRVTLSVSDNSRPSIDPVEMTSNVAGGASGGTIDVTVTNLAGDPVANAYIRITNTNLTPNVDIHSSAIRTDSEGRMIIPALLPDGTTSYFVTASKAGYNTATIDPGVVVLDGLPYTVVQLTIDELASFNVKVVDGAGAEITGLIMRVRGPEGFDNTFYSSSGGESFTSVRYSTDLDPYLVRLLSGQGYEPQEIKLVLDPGSSRDVVVTAVPLTTTTTTLPETTTTTAGPATTTTTVKGSLRVTVYRNGSSTLLKNALVTLSNGRSLTTGTGGWVFFDNLPLDTYGITVTKSNYYDYSGSITITGANTRTVYLVRK